MRTRASTQSLLLTTQVGTPSEIGQVILLLATNRYMNGAAIAIDGGWLTTHA